ncbi:MAG: choice-of-anchor Q domain-containing protein, partial [Planctomycetota bacterium]
QVMADDLNVPADFPTIQSAINAAQNGDEIVLAPGTYVIDQPLDTNVASVATDFVIRSSDPDDPAVVEATVIDARAPSLFAGSIEVLELAGLTALGEGCDRLVEGEITRGFTLRNTVLDGGDSSSAQFALEATGERVVLIGGGIRGRIGEIRAEDLMHVHIDGTEFGSEGDGILLLSDDAEVSNLSIADVDRSEVRPVVVVASGDLSLTNVTLSNSELLFRKVAGDRTGSITLVDCSFSDVVPSASDGSLFRAESVTAIGCSFSYTVPGVSQQIRAALEGDDVLVERCSFTGPENIGIDVPFADLAPIIAGRDSGVPPGGVAQAVVRDSTFLRTGGDFDAVAGDAAAIVYGKAIFERCHFEENSGPSMVAILNRDRTFDFGDSYIRDCTFVNNRGGAILRTGFVPIPQSDAIFVERAFVAGHSGFLYDGAAFRDPPTTVFRNSVYIGAPDGEPTPIGGGSAAIENCTFVIGPDQSEVPFWDFNSFGEGASIRNSIILYDSPELLAGDVRVETSIFDRVPAGATGSSELDPLFVRMPSDGGDGWGDNPDTLDIDESLNDDFGDLRLLPGSPAIDAGTDAAVQPGDVDFDGHPRILDDPGIPGVRVDIGAYEYVGTSCLPDMDQDSELRPADFNAWVLAFNSGSPPADQNRDGELRPNDFNAWIMNYNAGCP